MQDVALRHAAQESDKDRCARLFERDEMKIVKLEISTIRFELERPYITAEYKDVGLSEKNCVVVRLYTDTGLVGLGESDSHPSFTYEAPETVTAVIKNRLAPVVLGADPTNLSQLHGRMDAAIPGWPFAKAPLDVACYDVWAQSLGVPVYKLLGGRVRDRLPLIWPIGGGTPEENAAEASEKMEQGYQSFHIKIGAFAPDKDIARVAAIRNAVGQNTPLMMDANQGWDYLTAKATIARLQPYRPSMVEQPVAAWDREGMARLQASSSIPISADESLHGLQDAADLIRRDAARVFSLKTGKCGGLFRTRQIAAIAEASGRNCFVNSMVEMGISVATSLHLAATLPNLVDHGHALMSNLRIKEDILLDESFQYDGRQIVIPGNCSGLGIQIDEEVFERRIVESVVVSL